MYLIHVSFEIFFETIIPIFPPVTDHDLQHLTSKIILTTSFYFIYQCSSARRSRLSDLVRLSVMLVSIVCFQILHTSTENNSALLNGFNTLEIIYGLQKES